MADGEFLQALNDVVRSAFPVVDELVQLIQFEFGWSLNTRVTMPAPFNTVVFELIKVLDGDGQLDDLIHAILKARRDNPEVRKFVEQFRPQFLFTVDDAKATEQVRAGLGTVSQNKLKPEVQAVLTGIQAEVRGTADGIVLLEAFKKLHERFHNVDFRLLKMLEKSARAFRSNPTGEDELYDFNAAIEDFSGEVVRARELVDGLPTIERPVLSGWVQKLELATARFREALPPGTGNPESPIRTFIRPTLGQAPSTIHARLFEEARRLPLGHLIVAIRSVLQLLPEAAKARLNDCVSGLEVLQMRLRDVINEHNFWQKVDNDLRLIDDSIATQKDAAVWMEDVQQLLPTVLQDIDAICNLRPDVAWSRPLQESRKLLSEAIAGSSTSQIRLLFDTYQRRARGRFYDVDAELLQLCSRLVTLSGPLAELGEI